MSVPWRRLAYAWARSAAVIALIAVAGSLARRAQPPKIVAFTNVSAVPMIENQSSPTQTVS